MLYMIYMITAVEQEAAEAERQRDLAGALRRLTEVTNMGKEDPIHLERQRRNREDREEKAEDDSPTVARK